MCAHGMRVWWSLQIYFHSPAVELKMTILKSLHITPTLTFTWSTTGITANTINSANIHGADLCLWTVHMLLIESRLNLSTWNIIASLFKLRHLLRWTTSFQHFKTQSNSGKLRDSGWDFLCTKHTHIQTSTGINGCLRIAVNTTFVFLLSLLVQYMLYNSNK